MGRPLNILFTSSGRRVSLIRQFREGLERNGISARVFNIDYQTHAASNFVSDDFIQCPPLKEKQAYIGFLRDLCRERSIDLVIPLIDTELPLMAELRNEFAQFGTKLVVSSQETIAICRDKRTTSKHLKTHSIDCPQEYSPENVAFPAFLKPAFGSRSVGAIRINDREELDFYYKRTPEPILQELLEGDEFTVDVLVDQYGNVPYVVPRKRVETRSGEISKGFTLRDPDLIREVHRVVASLPGAFGPLTIQCFRAGRRIVFTEINPRFGGGVVLSIDAGADFPRALVDTLRSAPGTAPLPVWKEGWAMIRFDDAIFTPGQGIL